MICGSLRESCQWLLLTLANACVPCVSLSNVDRSRYLLFALWLCMVPSKSSIALLIDYGLPSIFKHIRVKINIPKRSYAKKCEQFLSRMILQCLKKYMQCTNKMVGNISELFVESRILLGDRCHFWLWSRNDGNLCIVHFVKYMTASVMYIHFNDSGGYTGCILETFVEKWFQLATNNCMTFKIHSFKH